MSPFPKHWIQLLTIWQERSAYGENPAVWRFSLEDPHSERRHSFQSLDDLVAFLQRQMEQSEKGEIMSNDARAQNEENPP
ncbi:MAG: hypothetical protein GXP42_05370 [Chloroflexi bacterium]|nr:hypothetical protein [Chloroflexota bacterium]